MSRVYNVIQHVEIKDMNNEPITTAVFTYGTSDKAFHIGGVCIVPRIGLREFEVVYDPRTQDVDRVEIISIEYDMRTSPVSGTIILKPATLIIGLHDIGQA